ncbi:hypothetical protein JCM19046_4223 [Bacillus sp. JCM 19046]|nr:hypothetical protein JCM19045_135 [Bacillus sp. JCM 19045]GAF19564.1 hypothetical protein JCM19046_4223 [Bacillus sp. JCM 19046]
MNDKIVALLFGTSTLMLIALLFNLVWLYAASFPIVLFAWMFLGAIRNGRIGSGYMFSLVSTLVIWLTGFLTMVYLDDTAIPTTYILGFPVHTFIMVYIVWLLPFFSGSLLYGLFFEKDAMTLQDWNQLKDEFNRRGGKAS